jgi:transposase
MSYDRKFREKVLYFIDKGNTIKSAHELFGVGTTTIKEWKKLRRETGGLANRPLKRSGRKICLERLEAYIAKSPDSYQNEVAELFGCTQPAVHYALKRLNMTRKKND